MAEKISWIYNVLQILVASISLLYGIKYWQKIINNGYLKLLPLYTAISLISSAIWMFDNTFPLRGLLQNLFAIFEFFIFYQLFFNALTGKRNYYILIALTIIFSLSLFLVAAFQYANQFKNINLWQFLNQQVLIEWMAIENIFIVIPILLYYKSLFNQPYVKNLGQDPVFLTITGILFCFALSIPLFAFMKIIVQDKQIFTYVYVINSLAYAVMHLFFIKAYKSMT